MLQKESIPTIFIDFKNITQEEVEEKYKNIEQPVAPNYALANSKQNIHPESINNTSFDVSEIKTEIKTDAFNSCNILCEEIDTTKSSNNGSISNEIVYYNRIKKNSNRTKTSFGEINLKSINYTKTHKIKSILEEAQREVPTSTSRKKYSFSILAEVSSVRGHSRVHKEF